MNSFDLGGTGTPLHFLHANGYPPECYQPLFDFFKADYRVFGMYLRPLWNGTSPEEIKDWLPFSNDLRFFLSSQPTPVIGVGHSIGAVVTLRTALRDLKKFRALVLLDPALFIPRTMIVWNIVRMLGLADRFHPLIEGAKKRRRLFADLEILFKSYRTKNIFRYLSDDSLRAYIAGITHQTANGYELIFSPEWEVHIYRTSLLDFDIWRDLPKLEIPTLIIRGVETDTFLEDAVKLIKQKQPKVRIEAVPQSTHLLPLEHPKEVFELMQAFLKEVS